MSDTTLVEDRLRETYHAVTTRTDYSVAPALVLDATPTPVLVHPRRRPVVTLVGVAIVVALVLGVLAFVQRDDSSTPRPTMPPVDTSPIFPPVRTHVGPDLHLVPSEIPAGFHLASATSRGSGGAGGSSDGTTSQVWAKVGAEGRVRGSFRVSWGPVRYTMNDGIRDIAVDRRVEFLQRRYQRVDVGETRGWQRGRSVAFVGHGQLIGVDGIRGNHWGQWAEALSPRQVLDVARGLVRADNGSYRVTAPPRGYRLAADDLPSWRGTGTDVRRLGYSDGTGRGIFVQLTNDATEPPGAALEWPLGARVVEIRGMPAVSTRFLNGGDGSGCSIERTLPCRVDKDGPGLPDITRYLQWLEPDGTRVTVTTVDLGDDAVFQIARSLRETSQEEWDRLVASAPPW